MSLTALRAHVHRLEEGLAALLDQVSAATTRLNVARAMLDTAEDAHRVLGATVAVELPADASDVAPGDPDRDHPAGSAARHACDQCARHFDTAQGLNLHQVRAHAKGAARSFDPEAARERAARGW